MELSPFAVNVTSVSPNLLRSFSRTSYPDDLVVLTTHAEDGFTLKQQNSGAKVSYQPLTPTKKSNSKVRHMFKRKS